MGRFLMSLFGMTQAPEIYTAAIGLYGMWLIIRLLYAIIHYISLGIKTFASQIHIWTIQVGHTEAMLLEVGCSCCYCCLLIIFMVIIVFYGCCYFCLLIFVMFMVVAIVTHLLLFLFVIFMVVAVVIVTRLLLLICCYFCCC